MFALGTPLSLVDIVQVVLTVATELEARLSQCNLDRCFVEDRNTSGINEEDLVQKL